MHPSVSEPHQRQISPVDSRSSPELDLLHHMVDGISGNSKISEAEKELILLDNDRWIALGMIVGRKGK